MITPVILCGGSGTRLWPLSVPNMPKQFHCIGGEQSLFTQTLQRAARIPCAGAPVVICNAAHIEIAQAQLPQSQREAAQFILEPCGRNTAPAVAAAALTSTANEADPLMLILAADHVIENEDSFQRAVAIAADAAAMGRLVTFGIVPNQPETGYGYIRKGSEQGDWSEVAEFVEKPDADTAAKYLASGQYFWNSGMFLFKASQLVSELGLHAAQILTSVRATLAESAASQNRIELAESFAQCPADSLDYAVMEKTDNAAVVPLDAGWSDIGSWGAVYDLLSKDSNGNSLSGDAFSVNSRNCLVRAAHRKVGIVGLEDVVVVETEDAVLVLSKDDSQRLKQLVEKINRSKA